MLGGVELRRKAQEMAKEEGEVELERLFRSTAKRGQQPNMSFFAFTATPKHKTLAIFGRSSEPFHRYTMRQAIEEHFIEDVLKNYVTYKTYYKLIKKAEEDPNVERKKAAKALARFMRLHPHNIGQKTEVMVEHFQHFTRHKIGGHAKAMVVTGSRLEAVRYKQEFDRYIKEKGYRCSSTQSRVRKLSASKEHTYRTICGFLSVRWLAAGFSDVCPRKVGPPDGLNAMIKDPVAQAC